MANKDSTAEFRSISGQVETAEPASGGGGTSGIGAGRKTSSTNTQGKTSSSSSASATPTPTLRKSSSTNLTPIAASPAPGQSPRTSRNTSPIRQDKPATPSGTLSTQPSAAAIQRALSASNVPQLSQQQKGTTVSEAVSRLPGRAPKSATASGDTTPSWPISPRLKSPPPSGPNSRRGSAAAVKKPDAAPLPSIQVLSATPQSNTPPPNNDKPKPDIQLQAPPPSKASSRGPSGKSMLETVQENSSDTQDPSPAAMQASQDLKPLTKISDEEAKKSSTDAVKSTNDAAKPEQQDKSAQPGESGSESAGNKSDKDKRGRRESTNTIPPSQQQKKPPTTTKTSYQQGTAKARQEAGKQNMTVETETVQSIPQSGLVPARDQSAFRGENSGTVRLRPSTETIRPKKERKKADRKTRSVNQGTATSKADLFEARVANAVDEANTSDSDETFVYESNPPEQPRRQRHHSRTPSVTSSHSMADQTRGVIRGYGENFGDDRRIGGKRSMKFSTNPMHGDTDSPESNNGTIRSHTPRHLRSHARNNHSAAYDPDSPFTQASKLRSNHLGRSRPTSPRSPQSMQLRPGGMFGSKKQESPYDFDAEQNADDERTPLMGTNTVRRLHNRGQHWNPRRHQHQFGSASPSAVSDYGRNRWCCSGRLGACLLTTLVVLLVIVSAVSFVFASNRPLYDVQIHNITNVLASEQELMLDLVVGAVNPNTLGISIGEMDVNLFAKSKHVGGHKPKKNQTESTVSRRRMRRGSKPVDDNPNPIQDPDGHWHTPGDEKDSDDLEKDAQTMLLGRIFHFDQALTFEASPFKQHETNSSGQVRLTKPGNKTESGGSERWEEVIQYPFELIVRGVLKYQLPISSRIQSAAVGAKVMVHPEDGIDDTGSMRVEPIDHSEHWQWIDWPEVNADGILESRVEELE